MTTIDQERVRQVGDAVAPAVVRIGRHGGRGCGVVVADGLVATNAHNLRDRTTQVTFADGRAAQARATAVDDDGDLTVLAVDTGGIAAPPWADEAPGEGAPVLAVAAIPGGRRVTPGTVSSVDRSFRGPRGRLITGAAEHTAPLGKGTSGSPVVDVDGQAHVGDLVDDEAKAIPEIDERRVERGTAAGVEHKANRIFATTNAERMNFEARFAGRNTLADFKHVRSEHLMAGG